MSKSTHTHEHPAPEPKKHGCCGGTHTKDEKAQPAAQEKTTPRGDIQPNHSHHSESDAGCCGSDKASK